METKTWLKKAYIRNHIEEEAYSGLIDKLNELGKRQNSYINSIGRTNNQ